MPALRVCVCARTLCRTHGKLRYIMFIRTSRLAERLAPSRWSPRGQPLCAFAASCEVFFKSPSLSSACAAMATMCSASAAETLRAYGRLAGIARVSAAVAVSCVPGLTAPAVPAPHRPWPLNAIAYRVAMCHRCQLLLEVEP